MFSTAPKDLQLLVTIVHECYAAGLDLRELFNKVSKRLVNDPNEKTGQAISQHIDKLRQRLFEGGAMVPPWNGRDNCPTTSQEFRGVIKAPKKHPNDPGWRDVTWDEKEPFENIPPDFPFNTAKPCPCPKAEIIDKPGCKPIRSFKDDHARGFTGYEAPIRRKKSSLGNVVQGRNGDVSKDPPFLGRGHSTRGPSLTTYAKKETASKRRNPRRREYNDSEDEDRYEGENGDGVVKSVPAGHGADNDSEPEDEGDNHQQVRIRPRLILRFTHLPKGQLRLLKQRSSEKANGLGVSLERCSNFVFLFVSIFMKKFSG